MVSFGRGNPSLSESRIQAHSLYILFLCDVGDLFSASVALVSPLMLHVFDLHDSLPFWLSSLTVPSPSSGRFLFSSHTFSFIHIRITTSLPGTSPAHAALRSRHLLNCSSSHSAELLFLCSPVQWVASLSPLVAQLQR